MKEQIKYIERLIQLHGYDLTVDIVPFTTINTTNTNQLLEFINNKIYEITDILISIKPRNVKVTVKEKTRKWKQ